MTRIAVLGTGRMGGAVARRLCESGHSVTVWNRTASRAAPLRTVGATVAGGPAEAVAEAEVVMLWLADDTAVESVLWGAEGALSMLPPDSLLAQMSTIGPEATARLRDRLPETVTLLDAPVKGSVPQIEAGQLEILASGPPAAVDRLAEATSALGKVRHCGPIPAASAVKLVVNAAMISAVTALADVRRLGAALRLPEELVAEQLTAGPLAGAVARAAAAEARFPIALAAKDLDLALRHDGTLPMLRAARDRLAGAPGQDQDLGTVVPRTPEKGNPR